MTEPREPVTEAGIALWGWLPHTIRRDWPEFLNRILAIEAEASRAAGLREAALDNGSRATHDQRERQHEETGPGTRHWWRCIPLDTAERWQDARRWETIEEVRAALLARDDVSWADGDVTFDTLDRLLAAPGAAPAEGRALDVDRLARAIHLSHAATMDEVCGYPDRPDAVAIAAEYARPTPFEMEQAANQTVRFVTDERPNG